MPSTRRKPTDHDEYIAVAPAFAVPILTKIRRLMHKACPDVEEKLRWGNAHYDYNGTLAHVATFKAHASFGFWRGKELSDPEGLFEVMGKTNVAMMRLEKVSDLPAERVLVRIIKEAMRLNDEGRAAPKKKPASKKTVAAPADLKQALAKKKQAHVTFDGFSPGARKEYVEWITEAKRAETREKRVVQAVEWMAEGKPRNWKYMKEWRGA